MILSNTLGNSLSPYLLQHKDNPVHWQEWSPNILEQAKEEKKPIFVSIGYATCHWCHVMAHESFEDEATADILNKHFICVKVDRETRPDVDEWLMDYVQRTTGHGGWPLNVFLTPEGKPFFGGTYFPPEAKYGMPSFQDVLKQILHAYGEGISVETLPQLSIPKDMGEVQVDPLLGRLALRFDDTLGGFGGAPKFPPWCVLLFLLRHAKRTGSKEAIHMLHKTLTSILKGGIYDHIGGGIHRYSVDVAWAVPHFEKMLYDQAMVIWICAEAYASTHKKTDKSLYARTIAETVTFLQREFTQDYGFASAMDADTEGKEGTYYIWDDEDISKALTKTEATQFKNIFDCPKGGNFEGSYVLNRVKTLPESLQKKLFTYRNNRMPLPFLDEKVVTSWNSMLGHALCMAARYVDASYLEVAQQLHENLSSHLDEDNNEGLIVVKRFTLQKEGNNLGFLEDHAWFGMFSLSLYELTGDAAYLNDAKMMQTSISKLFWKEELVDASHEHEDIPKGCANTTDHPYPSSTASTLYFFSRLGRLTGIYPVEAEHLMKRCGVFVGESPEYFGFMAVLHEENMHPMFKGAVDIQAYVPTFLRDPRSDPLQLCIGLHCETFVSQDAVVEHILSYKGDNKEA